jgi:hypothetical protein
MRRLLLSLAMTAAGAAVAEPGIAVNQIGYLPGAAKVAAVPIRWYFRLQLSHC